MAIKAISDSQMAYQGSVPTVGVASESVTKTTSSVAEPSSSGKGAADTSGANQNDGRKETDGAVLVGTEALKQAAEEINRTSRNSEAVFGVHDATNRITIKIIDKETKELIKEYPPEKTLDMIAKVWEMAGLMVDEKR